MVNPFRCYLSMVGECSVHYFMLIPKRNCAMYSKLNKGGKDPGCSHICVLKHAIQMFKPSTLWNANLSLSC